MYRDLSLPKNIERDALGSKLGRIHMERQDYDRLQTRKLKALKAVKVPGACSLLSACLLVCLSAGLSRTGACLLVGVLQKRKAGEGAESGEDTGDDSASAGAGASSGVASPSGGGEGRRIKGRLAKAAAIAQRAGLSRDGDGDGDGDGDSSGFDGHQSRRAAKRLRDGDI